MPLVVDRYALGPLQTNCYVVRSDRASEHAAVVDPGGDAAALRLELARLGTACAGILVTHGHFDHLGGVADLAEGTGAEVWMPEGERERLERFTEFAPVGVAGRAHAPEHLVSGGETIDLAGISFECLAVPGHSPAHVAYYADGELFSGDLLFAGSV
jgi:hydroxyacylglutathione hydrolase